MGTLTQMKCVACRTDAPTLTDAEIAELHPQVPDWALVELDASGFSENQSTAPSTAG
jgi:4a-hydroxytetrahydrobiopterin dehydratase